MKILICFFILIMLFTSCQAGEESAKELTAEQVEMLYNNKSVVINIPEGYLGGTLEKNTDLTSFKTAEQVEFFTSAPMIHIVDNLTYVLRFFPEDIEDGSYTDYALYKEKLKKEVEVYHSFDFTADPERIPLKDLEERNMTFYGFAVNHDDTYTVFSRQSGEFYLHILDKDGGLINEVPVHYDSMRIDMCYPYTDALYYIENNELIKNTPITDSMEVVDAANVFTRQGTELYYIRSEIDEKHYTQRSLWVYDLTTGEKREIAEINTGRQIYSIAYDTVNRVLYFSDYSYIYAHPLSIGGDIKVAAAVDTNITLLDAANGCLIAKIGHNQIAMYNLPESPISMNQEKITLRVCLADMEKGQFIEDNRNILMAMEVNGIRVTVEETYIGAAIGSDEYMNTMAKKLLSGDTDFDLFYVSTDMSSLFKEGYYEDLKKYPTLNYYFNLMAPGTEKLCVVGETLSLVPWSLATTMVVTDTNLIDGNNDYFVPTLFDDMIPYMNELANTLQKNGAFFIRSNITRAVLDMWFDQYLANFMAKTVDDETARCDLEKLFRIGLDIIHHSTVSIDSGVIRFNGRAQNTYFSQTYNYGINSSIREGDVVSATPKINPEYGEPFFGSFFAVNPNSENKELAALFLAFFMEYNKNNSRFYDDFTYQSEDVYGNEAEKLYKEQLQTGIRAYEVSGWRLYLYEKINDLDNGTITIEDGVDETFRYLKMIRDE